jgi:hypothetical protein
MAKQPQAITDPAPEEYEDPENTQTTRNTCVVGNKLPLGLKIQLDRVIDNNDGTKQTVPHGEPIILKGANSSNVIGGYGLTEDVDEEMFDAWLKQNASYHPVRNGLIFKQSTEARAKSQAKDQSDIKSGLEPQDPDKPGPGLAKAD